MGSERSLMGSPLPRHEARLKVTGEARYSSDEVLSNPAYAFLLTCAIAKGRIRSFDLSSARKVKGFLDVLTFENTRGEIETGPAYPGRWTYTLEGREIEQAGQIIAVVLGESFEAAREAAGRIGVEYEVGKAASSFDSPGATVHDMADLDPRFHAPVLGDAESEFEASPVQVEADYETSTQHHNSIELYTTSCVWDGDRLTVYEPSQFVYGRAYLAKALGIPPQNVRVVSTYLGGSFGAKNSGTPRTALVALAARRLGRPVKLVATREQGFTIATYRAESRHRIKLGAEKNGRIKAFVHESEELAGRTSNFSLAAGLETTAAFYNYGSIATKARLTNVDRGVPGWMRSPHETTYMFALESAMDELAYALDMDPVALRLANDTQHDPATGRPYTSRSLAECFAEAGRAFGWANRSPKPGSMRDGDWLVGWGCAASCYPANITAAKVRISVMSDGRTTVESAFQELGQGACTSMAQVAADRLGVDYSKVTVRLGDTDFPPGGMTFGSSGAASTLSAVADACEQIRRQIAASACVDDSSTFFGVSASDLTLTGKGLTGPGGSEILDHALSRLGGRAEAVGSFAASSAPKDAMLRLERGIPIFGGHSTPDFIAYSHGAQFVEVHVHSRTKEVRVPRIVGAYAAGTIVNERMVRSQLSGGIVWGVSCALHEATEIDPRSARYINTSLAEYLLPVNADIQDIEIIIIPEKESSLNAMGIKGVGELGNIGMNAAICNAVFHATGKRVRKIPIRIEDIL